MFKAFSGALSLMLALMVIKIIAPEVFNGLIELTVNVIRLANMSLETTSATSTSPIIIP